MKPGGLEPDYRCRECGTVSDLIIGPTQAFCTKEGCRVLTFNPSLPDGGASDMHEVDLSGLEALFRDPGKEE